MKFKVKSGYQVDVMITQAEAKDKVEKARKCLNCIFQFYGGKDY
jgi:hypothetical protein